MSRATIIIFIMIVDYLVLQCIKSHEQTKVNTLLHKDKDLNTTSLKKKKICPLNDNIATLNTANKRRRKCQVIATTTKKQIRDNIAIPNTANKRRRKEKNSSESRKRERETDKQTETESRA